MHTWYRKLRLDYYCVTCADVQCFLSDVVNFGITITEVKIKGDITLSFYAENKFRKQLELLANKHSAGIQISTGYDIHRILNVMKKRSFLIIGLTIILMLSILLPQRVLFVEVTGNDKLPDNLLLENAEQCGIKFGAMRKELRSENVKNALLSAVPELQWVGVNTSGCVATISVIERSDVNGNIQDTDFCNIVASRDGIIKKCTVISGNPLCKPGQAIKEGQMLVSGYIDTGLLIRTVKAEAEITALTNRDLYVVSPGSTASRGEIIREENNYSIIIGKKLINFFKGSGILDSSCVKIRKIYPLVLPGGFALPISLVRQNVVYYEPVADTSAADDNFSWLYTYAQNYLRESMVAGSIIKSQNDIHIQDGTAFLSGTYFCEEIIGKSQNEVNLNSYAKDS